MRDYNTIRIRDDLIKECKISVVTRRKWKVGLSFSVFIGESSQLYGKKLFVKESRFILYIVTYSIKTDGKYDVHSANVCQNNYCPGKCAYISNFFVTAYFALHQQNSPEKTIIVYHP